MLTPERWARVQELFGAALALGPEARPSFVEEECAGDAELRREIESLLASHDAATSKFLASPPFSPTQSQTWPAESGTTIESGVRLGPYEVVSSIGSGGMGQVYRARDSRLDRDVAVKVLPAHLSASVGALARFQREAKAVAALSHPNILAIHDFGTEDGVSFAVMELLDGKTLRAILEEGPMPEAQAIDYAMQLARGLAAAHEQGIVHRDLKPENIFISKGGHLKVLDFGLAKRDARDEPETSTGWSAVEGETQPGTVMGTVGYMSPEQVNAAETDQRTDIFSFGAILYEMLSGRRTFRKETPADTMAAILLEQPPPLKGSGRRTSLDRIVRRCLEKEPDRRFQSSQEALAALTEASKRATRGRRVLIAAVVTVAIALGMLWTRRPAVKPVLGPKRIAVLPFENLGAPEDDYFAEGMSDEVRSKLTALPGVEVIARGSSTPYKKTSKRPQEIANELGVGYLLTATVRWERLPDGSRVHVVPELAEVTDSGALASKWQEGLDEPLTDVFRMQSSIAARVSSSLGLVLGARDKERLSRRPTENLEAYDDFLRGESLSLGDRRAIAYYQTAVGRDPRFGKAWAKLARSQAYLYSTNPSDRLARQIKSGVEQAKEFGPEDPETFLALSDYEEAVNADPQVALEVIVRGQMLSPTDPILMAERSTSELELGRWSEAEADARAAERLDPRSADTKKSLSFLLLHVRRYREAREVAKEGLRLRPLDLTCLFELVVSFIGEGDLAGARAVLKDYSRGVETDALVAYIAIEMDLGWVQENDELDFMLRLSPSAFGGSRRDWAFALAQAYSRRGNTPMVRKFAEIAREGYEASVSANPKDGQALTLLGLSLAYLGHKDESIRQGLRGLELAKSPLFVGFGHYELARIYTVVGEHEKAMDQLEGLLKRPHFVSAAWVRIDPNFESLHGNPRFQTLVSGS